MAHVVKNPHTGQRRPLSEGERALQKKQKEKADYHRRNGPPRKR